ncbi:MAG: hypothetical protein MUF54_02375 [Polyangiaceae bacterium]|jgi:hypothetical protein|nr:hypothetical protein [Polyangiaceae bacterium]
MNAMPAPPEPAVLAEFFHRLAALDQILRLIVSDARLRAKLTIRGSPARCVVLDLTAVPAIATDAEPASAADIVVAMSPGPWHQVLSGALLPGEALGRREMLLRGSPNQLARFIPLFDFAPLLYREHVAELTHVSACSCGPHTEDLTMSTNHSRLRFPRLLRHEALQGQLTQAAGRAAYVLGYCAGFARGRFFPALSLFHLLESMSRGLEAAQRKSSCNERSTTN